MNRLGRWLRVAAECLLCPQACCVCGAWTANPEWSPLCGSCFARVERLEGPLCEICGEPVPANILGPGYPCARCRSGRFDFVRARAWGPYSGTLRTLIREFKFSGLRRLAAPLSSLLYETYAQHFQDQGYELLLPVPLHPRRVRERGFDQTRMLARRLAQSTGLPLFDHCRRTRHTPPQLGLEPADRTRNVRDAFALTRPQEVKNRMILVIDDVMTTGATVQELSRLLKRRGGAREVGVLTLARVIGPHSC